MADHKTLRLEIVKATKHAKKRKPNFPDTAPEREPEPDPEADRIVESIVGRTEQ